MMMGEWMRPNGDVPPRMWTEGGGSDGRCPKPAVVDLAGRLGVTRLTNTSARMPATAIPRSLRGRQPLP
jgi:hypothetical protein